MSLRSSLPEFLLANNSGMSARSREHLFVAPSWGPEYLLSVQKSFPFQTMTNENMKVNWLHLPRIPFDVVMTKIVHESLTDLRSCSRVCSSWSEMIEKDILKNLAVMDTVRDKMKRAFGPEAKVSFLDRYIRMLPSSEQISNAKWLSK